MIFKTLLNNYQHEIIEGEERNILKYKDIDGKNIREGSELTGAWMSSPPIDYYVVRNKKGRLLLEAHSRESQLYKYMAENKPHEWTWVEPIDLVSELQILNE